MKLISVVLSGGAGTRLWPVSRQAHPKPFMKLGGSALLERLSGKAPLAQPRACIAYAAGGSDRLAQRLAKEAAKP